MAAWRAPGARALFLWIERDLLRVEPGVDVSVYDGAPSHTKNARVIEKFCSTSDCQLPL